MNNLNRTGHAPAAESGSPRRQKRTKTLAQVGCWLLVFLVPVALCITVLVQTHRERQAVRAAAQAAEAATEQLRLENQRLQEEIEALRSDPEVIERIAREELNMLRPEELVFSFPEKKSTRGRRGEGEKK